MNPAVMVLANRSVPFWLYDFNLAGVSAQELASAYSLPPEWVRNQIESVRMMLKYQVKLARMSHEDVQVGERATEDWGRHSNNGSERC